MVVKGTLLLLVITCMSGLFLHSRNSGDGSTATSEKIISAPASDSLSFATSVFPILKMHCNPCHFPGGKMYERMPFDQSATLLEHAEGIMKRINDAKEKAVIQQFVNAQSKF